ncbi:MAG TPA: M23 family metallopeptidase [Candidatus Mcinerneyibacterium sp.]|nr:M23 family metallopeptidase [Candidatus Mcinerneyibacterium sp.]
MNKKIKIKIISSDNRKVKRFSFSKQKLYLILSLLIVLTAFILLGLFKSSKYHLLANKYAVTRVNNKKLRENYTIFQDKLKTYDDKLEKLEDICDNVLILNSLPPAFKGKDNVHVGGRAIKKIEGKNVDKLNDDLNIEFSQVNLKVKLLKSNFYKVIDKMENSVNKWDNIPIIWPIEGWISSKFGWRESPFSKNKKEFHTGLDITNLPGSPIKAAAKGYVSFAGWLGVYGKVVIVEHGFGYETRYGHLNKINVEEGMYVKKGYKIGTLGNTGRTTAPHLHYEILKNGKLENPMKYLIPEENKILRRVTELYGR